MGCGVGVGVGGGGGGGVKPLQNDIVAKSALEDCGGSCGDSDRSLSGATSTVASLPLSFCIRSITIRSGMVQQTTTVWDTKKPL